MADKAEVVDLTSEAKEEAKDVKQDNAVVEDSKEDTKNGEKDEDEESSEGEEHPGLYDQPVVIEGKRERKTTVFLANQTSPQVVKTAKPLVFEGKGESLGSMERTNYELGRSTSLELKPLHKLLFGRDGRANEIKKNIRKFNGFTCEKGSKEYEAKKFNVERFTNDGLKRLCEIFDLEKKGKRQELQEKVMDFLMLPMSSGRPAPQPKAKKAEKKKRKRSKKDSSKSKTSAKSKKTESVESGDEGDEEDEDKEEEEEEEEEEPPKKKKKSESPAKKKESSPKKGKGEKTVKDKGKGKDKKKEKSKAKKTDDKTKASKKKEPVAVKITPLKKSSPKKTPKKEKPAPVEDDSSDEEPLAKKTKKEPPTDSELEKIVKDLLKGADLEQVTMKSVCKQVYDMYPEHDLSSRKDFIKKAVKKVIS